MTVELAVLAVAEIVLSAEKLNARSVMERRGGGRLPDVRAAQPTQPPVAVAVERSRIRRIASYQVQVTHGDELVADVGLGYRTDRWHFGEDAWPLPGGRKPDPTIPVGPGQAVRSSSRPSSAFASLRIRNFCTLPVTVSGELVDEPHVAGHLVVGDRPRQ